MQSFSVADVNSCWWQHHSPCLSVCHRRWRGADLGVGSPLQVWHSHSDSSEFSVAFSSPQLSHVLKAVEANFLRVPLSCSIGSLSWIKVKRECLYYLTINKEKTHITVVLKNQSDAHTWENISDSVRVTVASTVPALPPHPLDAPRSCHLTDCHQLSQAAFRSWRDYLWLSCCGRRGSPLCPRPPFAGARLSSALAIDL